MGTTPLRGDGIKAEGFYRNIPGTCTGDPDSRAAHSDGRIVQYQRESIIPGLIGNTRSIVVNRTCNFFTADRPAFIGGLCSATAEQQRRRRCDAKTGCNTRDSALELR